MIQAALHKQDMVSYSVPSSLRTLFDTVWLGVCLYFVSVTYWRVHNVTNLVMLVKWTSIKRSINFKILSLKVYFWTSSPALPASEEGFQPKPSVTVKPAHDHQLPTANTCISRLYIPLYSSRGILKSKLLLAIKTKTFGFV